MKILKIVYYICVAVLSVGSILFGIAEPIFFASVIPAAFLLVFPKLYKKHIQRLVKKVSDIDTTQPESAEALSVLKTELEEKENSLNACKETLSEEENRIRRTNEKLDSAERELRKSINDMSGEAFEKYVGFRLARKGWTDIEYTSTTGDYGADIIATDVDGKKMCIQCKRYTEHVGIQAVQEIYSAKQYYNCQKAMVITNSTYTQAAIDLASKTGVDLWANFR